uniref:Uncharacterized protein n=1 Tax=Ditylenchus dipsaci TaxID=166011 RepID=A0A915DA83_9BILA
MEAACWCQESGWVCQQSRSAGRVVRYARRVARSAIRVGGGGRRLDIGYRGLSGSAGRVGKSARRKRKGDKRVSPNAFIRREVVVRARIDALTNLGSSSKTVVAAVRTGSTDEQIVAMPARINPAEAIRQARRPQYLRRDANLKALTQGYQAANQMEFLKAVQHHLSKYAFVRGRADGDEAGNDDSVEEEDDI